MSDGNGKFTKETKRILAERAGYRCGNPDCRRSTTGPHMDPEKSNKIGEAAHIRGRKPDSARYDPNMSSQERADIRNGIWLCAACHKMIDGDAARYPVETLEEWKVKAEERALKKLKKPKKKKKKKKYKTITDRDGTRIYVKKDKNGNLRDAEGFFRLDCKKPKTQ